MVSCSRPRCRSILWRPRRYRFSSCRRQGELPRATRSGSALLAERRTKTVTLQNLSPDDALGTEPVNSLEYSTPRKSAVLDDRFRAFLFLRTSVRSGGRGTGSETGFAGGRGGVSKRRERGGRALVSGFELARVVSSANVASVVVGSGPALFPRERAFALRPRLVLKRRLELRVYPVLRRRPILRQPLAFAARRSFLEPELPSSELARPAESDRVDSEFPPRPK